MTTFIVLAIIAHLAICLAGHIQTRRSWGAIRSMYSDVADNQRVVAEASRAAQEQAAIGHLHIRTEDGVAVIPLDEVERTRLLQKRIAALAALKGETE